MGTCQLQSLDKHNFGMMKQVLSLALLAVAVYGQNEPHMTCGDCHHLSEQLTHAANSEEAIRAMLDAIHGPVCDTAEDPQFCHQHLPSLWHRIVHHLFSAGWLCADLCEAKDFLGEILCVGCNGRINHSLDFMVNESAVLNAVAMLQNGMCQEDTEHAEMCAQAVEAILPVALEIIQRDRAWTQGFCRDTMHCHEGNHTPPPQ